MEIGRIWWQLVGVAPSEKCNVPEQPLGLANRCPQPTRLSGPRITTPLINVLRTVPSPIPVAQLQV